MQTKSHNHMKTAVSNEVRNDSETKWSSTQSPEKFFSANQMIDAYEKGCNDGYSQYVKKMRKEITSNITKATAIAEEFLRSINVDNNICSSIYLRVIDINQFDLLFAIKEEVFFDSTKSRPYYEKSIEFEQNNPFISIAFLPDLENINTNRLTADNYLFFYGKVQSH